MASDRPPCLLAAENESEANDWIITLNKVISAADTASQASRDSIKGMSSKMCTHWLVGDRVKVCRDSIKGMSIKLCTYWLVGNKKKVVLSSDSIKGMSSKMCSHWLVGDKAKVVLWRMLLLMWQVFGLMGQWHSESDLLQFYIARSFPARSWS